MSSCVLTQLSGDVWSGRGDFDGILFGNASLGVFWLVPALAVGP